MKRLTLCALILAMPLVSNALIIEQTIGDIDGLDLGLVEGQAFDFNDLVGRTPEPGDSDYWRFGDNVVTFTMDLSSFAVTALELIIGQGGACTLSGPCDVFVNSTFVGNLIGGSNNYFTTVLDITSELSAFMGSTPVEISLAGGDGWAMDYASVRATVPEPGTLALLGLGLAGLGLARRKKKI